MTDEVKTCDCKEKFCKKVKEFIFIAGAVFTGATLAILLCGALMRPKMQPMPFMQNQMPPAMERNMQGPQPMVIPPQGNFGQQPMGMQGPQGPQMPQEKQFKAQKFNGEKFQGRPDFAKQQPENAPMPVKK